MAVKAKNTAAGKLRADAEMLRAKLSDETVQMSKTEVEQTADHIAALEARANLIDGFTPQDEIERQGGDAEVRAANPESKDASADVVEYRDEMERIAKDVRKHFGGPNGYLLSLAKRRGGDLTFSPAQEGIVRRLQSLHKRATVVGTASDGSGGEFLLPLQQVNSIFSMDVAQPSILDFATRYPVVGRSLRIPYVKQDQASNTRPMAGIANVTIVDEAGEKPQREPTFGQRLLTVYKIAAYSEIGDETLSDDFTGDLAPTLQKLVGGQVVNFLGELCTIDGDGTGDPLGALNATNGALLGVDRETSMSITTDDVFAMYAKHTFGMGQSRWLINRTAVPQLLSLTLNGNTLVTFLPNLQNAPSMQLLGIPVVVCDMLPVLGVNGDLALVNGGFYAYAIRQALTVESSIHYKFRNDITAYRFITRGGGIPIPTSTFAYKSPGGTKEAPHSPFVILNDAATS